MEKVEMFGHTMGAIFKKKFYSPVEFNKVLEEKTRIARKIQRKRIEPKLCQTKIEFLRSHILVNVYKTKDFSFKKPVVTFTIDYRNIDRTEIKVFGNRNPEKYYKDFKIRFYNELNEEIFYFNLGSNDEFYAYRDSVRGYQLLLAHLNINNIEYDVFDETYIG